MTRTPVPVVVPTAPVATLSTAWRACVGTGRTREVLHADYRDSLAVVQEEIGFGATRAHGILHDDMGLVRPYDHGGRAGTRYGFAYVDLVIDTWLGAGMAPFLELGFMPAALASGDQTQFWWRGNVTPPRDHDAWADLVRALLGHLVQRYGIDQVRGWPVEVWNEPNLPVFWQDADEDAYHRLYAVTARAVKDIDPQIAVGGPAVSPGADDWLPRFAEYVERAGVPCDFVSKHAYTSGPAQHVPFGTYQTLRPPQDLLTQFGTPRSLLAETGLAGLPVHITEFSSSYRPDNPVHDTAYQAAYLAPVLAHGGDLVDSFSYWTLCDVFEEEGVPTAPLHGGFGLLGHRQLRKPVFHLYAFMARLGADILARGADHLVTRHPDGRISALLWQPVDGATVAEDGHRVRLDLPGEGDAVVTERHVDALRGNARAAWQVMGSPLAPDHRAMADLHDAATPAITVRRVPAQGGRHRLDVDLGRHGIALVEVTGAPDRTPPWLDERRLLGAGEPR
ncbi:GH39 family glycosyl hydrolase [Cellulomonas denverensis]|uniref:Xylan 1,4-beta-xylosidase n=1 Tax=Cellulomonas denverensis TaxID=264297 RepID=A0A7X6R0L2_9CELL|nr:xylan 1,4-beta-xylosidase [Cellulomonas denverensis]NKY24251.1 xylan 1,4-beta-xylosidase [Cellulomonas denverensis]GIG26726.1 beta-xylosidase [Cellulomonas denverensis]